MADIQSLNLSRYTGKATNSLVSASEWNGVFDNIQTKVNEVITRVNEDGGQDTPTNGAFTINGSPAVVRNDGTIRLASKGKYVLRGTLSGARIIIGTATDTFDSAVQTPTQVILAGCTIVNDLADNSAIEYAPESEKLIVTIASNTVNHLVCTHEAAQADGQKGALHCENTLILQGAGYLSVVNKGGHGIKASELRSSGNIHLYADAIHDAVHGNKMICIDGGIYYVNSANDAFGTRAESGTPGSADYKSPGTIWLFGGEFYAYNVRQKVFDSKAEGHIFCTEQVMNTGTSAPNTEVTGIVVHTSSSADSIYSNVTAVDPRTYFGAAFVVGATLADGVYTATQAAVTISGYFQDVRFVFPIKSTEVTLNGAYIKTAGTALDYTYDGKNIKVTATKDTVNIIKADTCINSINNIAVEPKNFGILYMDGNVAGSEVTFRDGFGSVIVNGDVTGSQVLFAEAGKPFGGSLMATQVKARLSGKGAKGNVIVAGDDMMGCVTTPLLISQATATIAGSEHIHYAKAQGSTFVGDSAGPTHHPYIVIPYGQNPIPSVQ